MANYYVVRWTVLISGVTDEQSLSTAQLKRLLDDAENGHVVIHNVVPSWTV